MPRAKKKSAHSAQAARRRGKIRIAVAGCGKVSGGHLRAWKHFSKEVEVVGLYDPVRRFCVAQKKRFALRNAVIYDGFEQLLADGRVDAVNLCSMSDAHDAQIALSLEAGKHVLTEKPTGYTLQGCRRLRWYARRYPRLKVGVAYSLRYSPLNIEVRRLIRAGAIGQPMWGHLEHHHPGHGRIPSAAPENRGIDPATDSGGRFIPGSEMTHATHPFDLARYLLGEPREVYAIRNASGCFATITFVDEAIGQVQSGSSSAQGSNWVTPVMIQGTAGTIYTERVTRTRGRPARHTAYLMNRKRKGGKIRKISAGKESSHNDLVRAKNFIDALLHDAPLICGLEDSVRSSELLHAIWNSYSLGLRVPIQRRERTG